MASPGTFISTVGHCGLITWLVIGWGLSAEPLEIQTMDVSLVSGEEFDEMRAPQAPDPGEAEPEALVPEVVEDAPTPLQPPPAPEPLEVPQPAQPEEAPASPTPPSPAPLQDVADAPMTPPAPPPAPPLPEDLPVTEDPTPPQAPVVASDINEAPEPEAEVDDIARDEIVADDTDTAEVEQEEQTATAPEETTTEIVPEDFAPARSIRPTARPSRPSPPVETASVETEPEANEAPAETEADVNAALADALATQEASAPAARQLGQALTSSESGSFARGVGSKWIVDTGSEAATITVVVRFSVDRDRRVVGDIVLVNASSGSQAAQQSAFNSARRAVLRASQAGGLPLPPDKYEQWKELELTFDPNLMRLR